LLGASPGWLNNELVLAAVYNNLSALQAQTGALADALRTVEKGRALQERLVKAFPALEFIQDQLASSLANRGRWLVDLGKLEEGLQSMRQAVVLREKLAQAHPSVAESRHQLAGLYHSLGTRWSQAVDALRKRELREEARRCFDQGRRLGEQLVSEQPASAPYRYVLASNLNELGEIDRHRGQLADALRWLERAQALAAELVRDHPAVPDYAYELSRTYFYTGKTHQTQQKFVPAVAAYRQAQPLQEKLVAAHSDVVLYRVGLAEIVPVLRALPLGAGAA
jgi:tetratricopeptide (TPR) repeat protein